MEEAWRPKQASKQHKGDYGKLNQTGPAMGHGWLAGCRRLCLLPGDPEVELDPNPRQGTARAKRTNF